MDIDELPSARAAMLCWTPGTDQVAIVPWPDLAGFGGQYKRTTLACNAEVSGTTDRERLKAICFIEAMHLIVRDGCDPAAVHLALCGIREYRDGLSSDVPTTTGEVLPTPTETNVKLRADILKAVKKEEDGVAVGKLPSKCRMYREATNKNRQDAVATLIADGCLQVIVRRGGNGKMFDHLMTVPAWPLP